VINQSDYQDQADIYNKYEVLSKQLINATETGIQTSPTTIGAISASPTRTTIKVSWQQRQHKLTQQQQHVTNK
jgi:hypothetical protein